MLFGWHGVDAYLLDWERKNNPAGGGQKSRSKKWIGGKHTYRHYQKHLVSTGMSSIYLVPSHTEQMYKEWIWPLLHSWFNMYIEHQAFQMKMQKMIVTSCHGEYEIWRRSKKRARTLCQSLQLSHCIECILHHWLRFRDCIGGIEHLKLSYRKVLKGYYSFRVTMAHTG